MDRHLDRIHALAWHMSGDRALAEDVSQETFLRFWQTAPNWDASGKATILTWLRRVATWICFDENRRKTPIFTDQLPDQEDGATGPHLELVRSENARAVQAAMMTLPDRQRAALVLSFYQQVSQADGAAALGVSEKAYESLLSRARVKLKSELMAQKESLAL